jgi:asparagine synthase (glutamine-hydrolysing)
MCGIYFCQEKIDSLPIYKKDLLDKLRNHESCFSKIAHRGPDNSIFVNDAQHLNGYHCFWGFHRLAINGQTPESNQPFFLKGCRLICNGEIYNFRELIKEFGLESEYQSRSDCEVIIHLYKKLGMQETLRRLDGVFALVLHDYESLTTYVARDPVGVRSLFMDLSDTRGFAVASELKALVEYKALVEHKAQAISQFPPGCFCTITSNKDIYIPDFTSFYENLTIINSDTGVKRIYHYALNHDTEDEICANIAQLFESAVVKRLMSERKVGALLSGGLDSSSVVAIMCRHINPRHLNTYSIGLKGSTDLVWAKKVADFLGTNHHEICLTEFDFLSAISETIQQIESYDTTSVRASIPNYLVSKYIYENSDDCVIYCGDMSDEIFGSYRGFMNAPSEEAFQSENQRMIRDVCYFDLLRSDKSISGAGLEARVPFADKKFLQYVMSIPPRFKMFDDARIEKYIFRKAFSGLLPDDILWRRKEAFSDGVSGHQRSWFQIIKEFVDARVSDEEFECREIKESYDKESYYYRKVFELYYPGCSSTIPYYWRHPFCEEQDPSARLLQCYVADE